MAHYRGAHHLHQDTSQYLLPPDYRRLLHEEQQDAEKLMQLLEQSAVLAGEYYNLRCPIAAEAKQGKTWADVH